MERTSAPKLHASDLFAQAGAAIFDMDGVLTNNEAEHLVAWKRLIKEHHGGEVSEDLIRQTFGQTNDVIIPALWELAGAEHPGGQLAELSFQKEFFYREAARGKIQPLAGIERLLAWIESEGIPIAVGTSAPIENVEFVLEEFGWTGRFREIVHRARFVGGKPAPDCFLCGSALLGHRPRDIVVFEDSVHGLDAARCGGFQPCALATAGDADRLRTRARWVLRDFRDVSC